LVFGHDKVTTGASNDIQKATSLARRYVSQWGLSDAIGPVLVGDNEQEVFLGRELSRHREVSERTAQLVDAEVTRLLNDSYARAKQTLIDNRDLLERMAEALLERETLTADDAATLVQGNALPPRKSGAPPSIPVPVAPGVVVQPKPTRPGLLGGPEVAPA
jgi:cell division protease FtsH